nr:hypothetical protein HK105_000463 [Polyrhizophydium stewartii]
MDTPHAALAATLGQLHAVRQPPQAAVEHLDADNKRLSADVSQPQNEPAVSPPASATPPRPQKRFRPSISNEWDRMPAEVQRMLLEAAGPFTLFVCGLLLKAELFSLSEEQKERLWQDIIDADWQGDLFTFPSINIASASISLRRPIVGRLKVRYSNKQVTQIVIRNGWTDLLDFSNPVQLLAAAISLDDIGLIQTLYDQHQVGRHVRPFLLHQAVPSRVATLKFLNERFHRNDWRPWLASDIHLVDNLEIIIWLDRHHPECLEFDGLWNAAQGNHMHIVRWLVENTGCECSLKVLAAATRNNNLEMVEFLAGRFPLILDTNEIVPKLASSDMSVILWIEAHGRIDHDWMIEHLCSVGDVALLNWYMDRFKVDISGVNLYRAYHKCQTKLLKWLYKHKVQFGPADAQLAASACNTDIMQWAIQRNPAVTPMLFEATAVRGDAALVEWWRVRHGVVFGQRELEMAIRDYNCRMVKHLLEMDGADWDLEATHAALDDAEGASKDYHEISVSEMHTAIATSAADAAADTAAATISHLKSAPARPRLAGIGSRNLTPAHPRVMQQPTEKDSVSDSQTVDVLSLDGAGSPDQVGAPVVKTTNLEFALILVGCGNASLYLYSSPGSSAMC